MHINFLISLWEKHEDNSDGWSRLCGHLRCPALSSASEFGVLSNHTNIREDSFSSALD